MVRSITSGGREVRCNGRGYIGGRRDLRCNGKGVTSRIRKVYGGSITGFC